MQAPVLQGREKEMQREAARRMAIYSGDHKFITLKLRDRRFRNISGVEVVNAHPYINEMEGGIEQYHLEVAGGDIRFEFKPHLNAFMYDMLDSEHNRAFLTSHYHTGLWSIEDKDVDKDIAKASKELEESLKKKKPKKRIPRDKTQKEHEVSAEKLPDSKSDLVEFKVPSRIGVAAP